MMKMMTGMAAAALAMGLMLPGSASAADTQRADGLRSGTPQITDVSAQRRWRRRYAARPYYRYPRYRYYPRRYYAPYAYAYPYPYYRPYYGPGFYFGGPGFGVGVGVW